MTLKNNNSLQCCQTTMSLIYFIFAAHPKVKLFISHGGALGINEAVYEGVPVLGIPMYADQMTNLEVLRSYGAAEILHYSDITNDSVLPKIQQVTDET